MGYKRGRTRGKEVSVAEELPKDSLRTQTRRWK